MTEKTTVHIPAPAAPAGADSFIRLGLSPRAIAAVNRIGFSCPTEIQVQFIPAALTARDCVGRAKTGTGKTAAFLLPIFEHFFRGEKIRALILAPTRELTEQIVAEAARLAGEERPRAVAVVGGKSIEAQTAKLRGQPEIVAATPGRLLDLSQRRVIDLSSFSIVVLDEVDRMFDMGFRKDIREILNRCAGRKQTLFLSATLPEEIMRMANRFLHDPIGISVVSDDDPSVGTLDQRYFAVAPNRKLTLLVKLLERDKPELALIFTRTKRGAERLGQHLQKRGWHALYIHGGLPQNQRDQAVADFRRKKIPILVATDVMGRGIDVAGISHVINYDVPENPEDYLHRVGRSARMDAPGKAFTFVIPDQAELLTAIEILVNREIAADFIPGCEGDGEESRGGRRR
jgi:ATP-dependent RNA helicase DeaD